MKTRLKLHSRSLRKPHQAHAVLVVASLLATGSPAQNERQQDSPLACAMS